MVLSTARRVLVGARVGPDWAGVGVPSLIGATVAESGRRRGISGSQPAVLSSPNAGVQSQPWNTAASDEPESK